MAKRAASWAAVSSLPQAKKISLTEQLAVNRQHIDNFGGQLAEELVVPGESRNIVLFEDACKRIDAYARLYELIKTKAIDVLVYLDRSRLGRKASLSMAVVELCQEAGIICYETSSPPANLDRSDSSHDGALIGAIKSVGAQQEIVNLTRRHQFGMIDRIMRGDKFPGRPPYGYIYTYDERGIGRIEIEPEQAAITRKILVEWYLNEQLGFKEMANKLNEMGIPSPLGKEWGTPNIKNFIRRIKRYAGYLELNRKSKKRPYTIAKGSYPPIITEEELRQIEIAMEQRTRSYGKLSRPFSGVAYCANCGRHMIGTTTFTRPKPEIQKQGYFFSYMICRESQAGGCYGKRVAIRDDKLAAVIQQAVNLLRDHAEFERIAAQNIAYDSEEILANLKNIDTRLAAIETQRQRYVEAFAVHGAISGDELKAHTTKLDQQRAAIMGERVRIESIVEEASRAQTLTDRLAELRDRGDEMLALRTKKPGKLSAWLSQRIRVYVLPKGIVERVEYL